MASVPTHEVFGALGDANRLALVRLLVRHGPATATGLAEQMDISRQGIAKHLGVLEEAGLVARQRVGRGVRYRLRPEELDRAVDWITETRGAWTDRLDALAAAVETPPEAEPA